VLILTKPIGIGVITTALKQGKAKPEWVERAVHSMTTLNGTASAVAAAGRGVNAITDITGFGLIGHGREMALGSGVALEIDVAAVPRIEGALEAIDLGAIPGGLIANREFAECMVADAPGSSIPEGLRTLLYDPQTSGGLLISVEDERSSELMVSLRKANVDAELIGRVMPARSGGPAIVLR
jgi:selenide,water dikinase